MSTKDFKPPWWLRGAHKQTIYPVIKRRGKAAPVDRIERVPLDDGDFVELAWAEQGLPASRPLVILLHGLGGSMRSQYIGGFMRAFNAMGWRAVLMHFRGAGPSSNRLLRGYHAGETHDFSQVLQWIDKKQPNCLKAAIGISLGGNVLLKWLGENNRQSYLKAAAVVSVPFDLAAVADQMQKGFSRLYQTYLLHGLYRYYDRKLATFEGEVPEFLKARRQLKTFWEFDDKIVAPLHGFKDVHDYYQKASCINYLSAIQTPTLIIHALNDPFMHPDILPRPEQLSPDVFLEYSTDGGHVGFVAENDEGKAFFWLEKRIPAFFKAIMGSETSAS